MTQVRFDGSHTPGNPFVGPDFSERRGFILNSAIDRPQHGAIGVVSQSIRLKLEQAMKRVQHQFEACWFWSGAPPLIASHSISATSANKAGWNRVNNLP